MCVGFFLWRQSCVFILSSCWGWGRLLLSLFWCDCSALFTGVPAVSAACHAAGYPSRVTHLADSVWLPYSCGGSLAWGWGCLGTDVLIPHLVFYLVPAQLPLPASSPLGFCTLGGCVSLFVSSLLVYSWGWVGGVFATSLGFLPCAMLLAGGVSGVCELRWRSRLPFVVRHGLGFMDRVLWLLVGPGTCCFLEPSLGSSLSLPGWLLA